ncbi:hypothetical protein VX159_07675 [Dechloromonas sp. ZY10]|uniref:hypothetical protein n=1 Tax=Dechloromonas aquae TaxID=2664436 RepID=UPI003527C463
MKAEDRLDGELRRLFLPTAGKQLCTPAGDCRLLTLRLLRSADWEALAGLLAGLADELELPLPALSVEAQGGYRLWFSLAEPVAPAAGQAFLQGLLQRYLPALPAGRVALALPSGTEELPAIPAVDTAGERWSAFIDPGLGAMFCDEAGLDIAPGRDRQADLLVPVRSWSRADFTRACSELAALVGTATASVAGTPPPVAGEAVSPVALGGGWQQVGTAYDNPRSFLLAVMNDPGASPEQRLRAAEALLPHWPA